MGADGSNQGAQIIQAPRQIGPLEQSLVAHSQLMLDGTGQFAPYGGGFRLTPQNLFGQVYVPGPNPTIFGNPFDYSQAQNYFGQSALQNGGSNAFPNSQQQGQSPPQQQQQQAPQQMQNGMQQLASIAPGLFNMSAFQQPAQANAGGGQQQQSSGGQQQSAPQQPQQPQVNPQELAMQQQFMNAIQQAGAFYPTNFNPQTGAFM